MSSSHSFNSLYCPAPSLSPSSEEEEGDSCFSLDPPKSGNTSNDSLSISRPLFFTFTMGSGSSGANTTIGSMSSSEPYSSVGTPVDTPPDTPGGESCPGETRIFGSGRGAKDHIGTDDLFTRRRVNSRIPTEVLDAFKSHLSASSQAVFRSLRENVDPMSDGTDGENDMSRMEGTSSADLSEEDCMDTPVNVESSPRRARRPPPLNLSSLSSFLSIRPETEPNAITMGGTSSSSRPSPLEFSGSPILAPSNLSRDGAPRSAPVIPVATSPIDLPPLPYSAPLPCMPRAPVIQPSIPELERSPSPLTLPSPGSPRFFGQSSSGSLSFSTPWLIDDVMSSPLPPVHQRTKPRNGHLRKISLGKQMANLSRVSANAPVPPSLKHSPFLNHPVSPFSDQHLPSLPSNYSRAYPRRLGSVGTPLKLHMNPYFAQTVTPGREGGPITSPPTSS